MVITGTIKDGTKRLLIENPHRGDYSDFSNRGNINFLEILGDARKEYFSHSNSGLRILTEAQATKLLDKWEVASCQKI